MLLLGIDATGCECNTSLYGMSAPPTLKPSSGRGNLGAPPYPACVRIQEPPPHSVLPNFPHLPTPIKEDAEHSLPQIDYAHVFLRLGGFSGVVCHRVFFGYRRNNEGRMEIDKGCTERAELRIPTMNLKILMTVSVEY